MRLAFAAGALCLSLVGIASQPEPPKAQDPTTIASAPGNEDAARHARRTACLKEAKAKKLVGAHRSVFLKDCTATPTGAGT